MKVYLYTILWNEEEMLGFFFRHYDSIVDRYFVYDNGSTDRTRELLAAHPKVEIRPFVFSHPDSYVLSAQTLHESMWQESRGVADWVIVTAVDELLYHPVGLPRYLRERAQAGDTALPALAFQMVSDTFPVADENLAESRRLGVPLDHYNKLSVFNPDAIEATQYDVGRHRAKPRGRVRYPRRDELLLLHYKFLGLDYVARRYALLRTGLGTTDRKHGFGHEYDIEQAALKAELDGLRAKCFDVTGDRARRLWRQRWWRWPWSWLGPRGGRLAALWLRSRDQ